MATPQTLWDLRKSLDEICTVPDKIISVYALEQHVWADDNSALARQMRDPELQTIEEFQIDPVRPFLNSIFRQMAAPYNPARRDNPIGQGYWIQAAFGSGKSHLLCFLSALALGDERAWNLVRDKEAGAGRGKRESLYQFWEDGLRAKSTGDNKGIFVVVKTLVGTGGGTVGIGGRGQRLTDYILEAAQEQLQLETGKNLSLYPAELLADRFVSTQDLDLYRAALQRFLHDPNYFADDEFQDVDDFIRTIQQNKSPKYKSDCGTKLWRFYTEYLGVRPQIAAETEDVLAHMVQTILNEGYTGVLLVLDEVSLFMKGRDEDQRTDDEQTLVVLSNRLAKVRNLPIWTVCSAQQAIESKLGPKNIFADDRLKPVSLLDNEKDYYDIVLARVRQIKDPAAIANYYLYYKSAFTWPRDIGEQEFAHFFPFHKPALEVLRAITYELTTTRSAIHFMHQTLKQQIRSQGREIIRLWELFDETVRYEEDPSGVHSSVVAIKNSRAADYLAYESCKLQIDAQARGPLKVHREKVIKTVQTLFLYHVARTRQYGITAEEIANSVMIPRELGANVEDNLKHYDFLAATLHKELRQVVESRDDTEQPRFRFDPVFTGVDPRAEFQKARDEAEANDQMLWEAWEKLLALGEQTFVVQTRQMSLDLAGGSKSLFRAIAGSLRPGERDQPLEVTWNGRQTLGTYGMRDFARSLGDVIAIPPIESDQTDRDFAVYIGTRAVPPDVLDRLIAQRKDPRIVFWTPGELTAEARDRLRDFAAYQKLAADWGGQDTEDAVAVIGWVANTLQTEMGKIVKIIDDTYARGRMDAFNSSRMDFRIAGELPAILAPIVDRVLTSAYVSRDIAFEHPVVFKREDGVKVINGIVRTGEIPKGAKPNQDISAAQNFGLGLGLIRRGADKTLDTSGNTYIRAMWDFLDAKLTDDHMTMRVETLYKTFMGIGIGGPRDYGLTRRMVQIYLLCLVRDARIRLTLTSKSGLSTPALDYSNIASTDFSSKVLEAFAEVQKLARPENWEVLRPFAEKLLDQPIPPAQDDAQISHVRALLRDLFARERTTSEQVAENARGLFAALRAPNPYAVEADQAQRLFATDLAAAASDIDAILYALKAVFGFPAFDTGNVPQSDVDELSNCLRSYRDLRTFLGFDQRLRVARAYCDVELPDIPGLQAARHAQSALTGKLADLRPYIDSELLLRTELLGRSSPDETAGAQPPGTLAALIRDYVTVYAALHNQVAQAQSQDRRYIESLARADDMAALAVLDGVNALKPPIANDLAQQLTAQQEAIVLCPNDSRASIDQQLHAGPVHECGLTFQNAQERMSAAHAAAQHAQTLLEEALNHKLQVLLSPAVHDRLRHAEHSAITALLQCASVADLRAYLVPACRTDSALVELLNRSLLRVRVKTVRIADFIPAAATVERGQLDDLAAQFKRFLEHELDTIEADGETLPILQLE